ncbi:MAG: UDP-2,3-diacylglucosamine diphosphatase LpxI, partial [Pseudomonadota bacterium]
ASGQVIAVEAVPGTAWMLQSLAKAPQARGGWLYKAAKPSQDRRVDMPTIGPDTITQAAAAGLAGIVVAAGDVLVLDRDATAAGADAAGLFLWVAP